MERKLFNFKSEKGFTMVELIVSIFILAVAILGSYYAFYQMVTTTALVSSRLTAAYLAQEGMEVVRNIRDTNWLKGNAWDDQILCSFGCEADYASVALVASTNRFLNIDSADFYSYSSGTPTKFKRRITVTSPGTDILDVAVQIQWDERGSSYTFSAEEYLYNWK